MSDDLVLLQGKVSSLQSSLMKADFFAALGSQSSPISESSSGVLAVAAAAMGMSGAAMGSALSSSSRFEDADRVSFELNGEAIQAWLWRNPFTNGDEVEVVASKVGDYWEALAVARPSDRIIALYPHLSRGRKAHLRYAAFLWLKIMFVFTLFFLAFACFALLVSEGVSALADGSYFMDIMIIVVPVVWLIFLLPGIHLTWRWMYFVRIAEDVFHTFGWSDVENVDLMKASKGGMAPDVFGYGYLYYRY